MASSDQPLPQVSDETYNAVRERLELSLVEADSNEAVAAYRKALALLEGGSKYEVQAFKDRYSKLVRYSEEKTEFLRTWLEKSPARAADPFGKILARRMVNYIDAGKHPTIVELGVGSIPITWAINEKFELAEHHIIEPNEDFVLLLKRRYPSLQPYIRDPSDFLDFIWTMPEVMETGLDAVVCAHPSIMTQEVLHQALALLKAGAPFLTFALEENAPVPEEEAFTVERSERIWPNLPSAHVFIYRRRSEFSAIIGYENKILFEKTSPKPVRSKSASPIGDDIFTFEKIIQDIKSAPTIDRLPEMPPRLWPRPARGRPWHGSPDEVLFAFIREVYSPFIEAGFRDQLRAYIFSHDKPLYDAITGYQRRHGGQELPEDIALPSRNDLVLRRLKKAAQEGFGKLSRPERRSVTGKLKRAEKPPKP